MRIKAIDGREFEITHEEAKRIAEMMSGGNVFKRNHEFTAKMHDFYSHYQHTAAENIRNVTEGKEAPKSEKEVKEAIAEVLVYGTSEEVAEVLFEAMEWQTAYANLKSIE